MTPSTPTSSASQQPGIVSRFQSIADTPGEPSGLMSDG
jgi:hypothetical protein